MKEPVQRRGRRGAPRRALLQAAALSRRLFLPGALAMSLSLPALGAHPPSILLLTLDTTRADAIGPDSRGAVTPAYNALAARGMQFRQAFTTVPLTLPAHTSIMTGLYPAGHGVHQNGPFFMGGRPLLAERLHRAGYQTAAFVSAVVLARKAGLARGFDLYDDAFAKGKTERSSRATTDRAIEFLARPRRAPLFLWVHYYDAHAPYAPPEPYRSRYSKQPYFGEIAAMDEQLGRLVRAFEATAGPHVVIVVGDHGEGLGEHGEKHHGYLLYQATMHVPLLAAGAGFPGGVNDTPVSTRHVFDTILQCAGVSSSGALQKPSPEIVLGEAMTPFLEYGWQPQVMAVDGRYKTIFAGRAEVYDLTRDPAESRDLSAGVGMSRAARRALHNYPLPTLDPPSPATALTDEDRKNLASLGYVVSGRRAVVDRAAPRPADMTHLFDSLERSNLERAMQGNARP